VSTCHRRKAGRKRCRVGTMSLATSSTSCDRERKRVGSGWRKTSFVRRRCGRETRWRERKRKAGGSRKRKRKTSGCWKRKGFPLHMPLDSEAAAVNVLETMSYFQGRRSVNDYLDQFKDLIEDSGYSDPKTIVVKFRRGLDGPRWDDLWKTRRHGSRSLVPSCRPNGPEPRRGRSLPHLPPTIQPSDPWHKPHSDGLPTCSGCSCHTLCPLQPVTRQFCPDGHRRNLEG